MRFTFFLLGIFIHNFLFSYSSGPPPGYHGQYVTCTSCHSGSAISGAGHVSISGLPSSYTPGSTYNLVLNLSASSARGYGFQMAVKDSSSFSGTLNTSHSGTLIDSNYLEPKVALITVLVQGFLITIHVSIIIFFATNFCSLLF